MTVTVKVTYLWKKRKFRTMSKELNNKVTDRTKEPGHSSRQQAGRAGPRAGAVPVLAEWKSQPWKPGLKPQPQCQLCQKPGRQGREKHRITQTQGSVQAPSRTGKRPETQKQERVKKQR